MMLKVLLPTKVMVYQEVERIVGESENGSFCILPRHIDFVTALVPGIFIYQTDGKEEFLAVDQGVLVKKSEEVLVSVRNAVHSENLEELKGTVENQFTMLDEREKEARSAIAKFEADFARRFLELEK